jgi:putative FmdB family regulatory protein|uniref:Zinc ribbon domain-containing protein n=1 Tax=candidate division WOR-3 bacterium TaxID=2052148 RepID=A0A7C6EBU3_UNCW3
MPTYEYQCDKCNYRFELFQKITDSPVKTCPVCNGKVRRLISGGSGLIFKGSGFYITDYKKKPETKEHKETQTKPVGSPKKS